MKENRYIIMGVALIIIGVVGLIAINLVCSNEGRMPRMMNQMMMGGGMMQGRGMMGGKGMMGDMMKNMDEINQKTEFSSNGERIFYTGTNSDGEIIKNSHGMEGVGCAMCHGADAQGMRMMMMDIPSLKWTYLANSKGHSHSTGRKHPPYTKPSFNVCVLAGIDPAGNELSTMMPRWEMESKELDDLVEYLKK